MPRYPLESRAFSTSAVKYNWLPLSTTFKPAIMKRSDIYKLILYHLARILQYPLVTWRGLIRCCGAVTHSAHSNAHGILHREGSDIYRQEDESMAGYLDFAHPKFNIFAFWVDYLFQRDLRHGIQQIYQLKVWEKSKTRPLRPLGRTSRRSAALW